MENESILRVRIEPDLKEKVEALYAEIGMSFPEAVHIFAVQSLLSGGIPWISQTAPAAPTAYGRLAKYGNAMLREKEEGAFALVMEEKYRDTH